MNRKVLYLIITLLVLVTKAYSQTFTLQGRVTDANMNPIELASVQVVKQGKASLTSLKGEFSMQLQSEDSVVVVFSMIGYKSKSRILRNPRGKQTLQVVLNEEDYTLKDVTVTEMKRQTGQTQELKKENMVKLPVVKSMCPALMLKLPVVKSMLPAPMEVSKLMLLAFTRNV